MTFPIATLDPWDEVFSRREVALLAEIPSAAVDAAVQGRMLSPPGYNAWRGSPKNLPELAPAYCATIHALKIHLSLSTRKRLVKSLAELQPRDLVGASFEIEPGVSLDLGHFAYGVAQRARRYRIYRHARPQTPHPGVTDADDRDLALIFELTHPGAPPAPFDGDR
ncbi:MAG: hypothetical protein QM608_01555 [Caulobacter sp.]